jgi:hypothetical protein
MNTQHGASAKSISSHSTQESAGSRIWVLSICALLGALTGTPALAQDAPTIGGVVDAQTIDGVPSATLWVSGVTAPEGFRMNGAGEIILDLNDEPIPLKILKVQARITPPLLADGSDAGQQVTIIHLLADMGGGQYESTYHGFFDPGTYEINVQALDTNGGKSDRVYTSVVQEASDFLTDIFEPNDTPAEATWIGINGGGVANNFHDEGDVDWFWFYVEDFFAKPHRNEVDLWNAGYTLGFGVGTLMQVYADDATTPLFEHEAPGALLEFFAHEAGAGFYFVRITSIGTRTHGVQTNYDMRVWREQGTLLPGTMTGIVTDSDSGDPIEGATVSFPFYGTTASGPLGADTNLDGLYTISPLVEGAYTVEASAPGYETETYETSVGNNETKTENFDLTADGSEGEGEGEGEGPICASSASGSLSTGNLFGDIGLVLIVLMLLWTAKRPPIPGA